jgi:hypothetical protein
MGNTKRGNEKKVDPSNIIGEFEGNPHYHLSLDIL